MIIKPDYNVNSVFKIDFEELKRKGIKALMFDLDSTVMPSKSGVFPKEITELFKKLEQNFSLAIISNNSKKEYIEKVKSAVSFDVIGNAGKPRTKKILDYLKSVNIKPNEAAMIGDRPLTDILAGKFAKTKTILVDSITKDNENKLTRIVRAIERSVIR